jgi:putative transmembrane protein PGPGW
MAGMPETDPTSDEERPLHAVRGRAVWGDDPEEIDASAVVEEVAEAFPETEGRWHDHPAFAPFKAVGLFIKRSGKRIAVTIVGFAVLLAGVAMLVLPGPGIVVIIAGLAILATEYVWAERMLAEAKRRAVQAKDVVTRKNKNGDSTAA